MTGYEFGDLVLVPFPFTDQSTIKQTPPRRGDQQCRLPSSATRPPDHGHYKSTTLHTVRGRDPDPGLARRRVAQAIRPQTDPRHHRPSPRAQEARTTNPDRSSRSSTDDQHHSRVGPPHPASFLARVLRVSHADQPHTPSGIPPVSFIFSATHDFKMPVTAYRRRKSPHRRGQRHVVGTPRHHRSSLHRTSGSFIHTTRDLDD